MLLFPDDLLPQSTGDRDEDFMREAILEAKLAWEEDEVPVGAVLVDELKGEIVARSHNRREASQRSTDHAELNVIEALSRERGSWRLEHTVLYVTLEPCVMCSGAILQARIPKLVYGASDPKAGACESLYTLLSDERLNHRCELKRGVHEAQCSELLSRYFKAKRAWKKQQKQATLTD